MKSGMVTWIATTVQLVAIGGWAWVLVRVVMLAWNGIGALHRQLSEADPFIPAHGERCCACGREVQAYAWGGVRQGYACTCGRRWAIHL